VCGNSTSGCVRSTVVDGSAYQFKVGVVEDCTFDRTEASHAINLFDMDQKYADVISLAEAITYLESQRPGDREAPKVGYVTTGVDR
jgi:nicotinamidase-related amidase